MQAKAFLPNLIGWSAAAIYSTVNQCKKYQKSTSFFMIYDQTEIELTLEKNPGFFVIS